MVLKKLLLLFGLITALTYATDAQTTINGSFMHGGILRTYSFYVPASYQANQPLPLIIGLHGTGSDGAAFAQYRDFRPIADTANFIMVHPDGSTLFGLKFWNYENILGSNVDDVDFIESLIDTISAQYNINAQRVYCVGMSNGSFMAYKMACESNKFAAIGSVTGSMSFDMYANCVPNTPIPSIHMHGTNDNTNPYIGTSTMVGIDQMNRFWVDINQCDTTPIVTNIADIDNTDNATAIKYLYKNGLNNHTVELFKILNGGHTWPNAPMPNSSETICMDFDARKEIWRFFNQYSKTNTLSINETKDFKTSLFPNPCQGKLTVVNGQSEINELELLDLRGQVIHKFNKPLSPEIDLSKFENGNYFIRIHFKDETSMVKSIILSNR